MPVMLAEDLGGWLLMLLLLLGAALATLLSLGALYPAIKGMRWLTIGLILPGMLICLLTTGYLATAYIGRNFHDRNEIMSNYVQPWFYMAFPPLAAGLLSGSVLLWSKRRKQ